MSGEELKERLAKLDRQRDIVKKKLERVQRAQQRTRTFIANVKKRMVEMIFNPKLAPLTFRVSERCMDDLEITMNDGMDLEITAWSIQWHTEMIVQGWTLDNVRFIAGCHDEDDEDDCGCYLSFWDLQRFNANIMSLLSKKRLLHNMIESLQCAAKGGFTEVQHFVAAVFLAGNLPKFVKQQLVFCI